MIVRGVGFFKKIEDIENVVIKVRDGTPIRIKDVGRVGRGPGFRRGALDNNCSFILGDLFNF
jgi:Cu(I)/Ag(I) efflux system membrane protein CusA/SilA